MDLTIRPRRLRGSESIRRLCRETRMSPDSLIYPIFVDETLKGERPISSLSGQFHYGLDAVTEAVEECLAHGVGRCILFGLPARKDAEGSSAWAEHGVVQEAIRTIKAVYPDFYVITDVCMCEYTDHGHCGALCGHTVDNDATLELLARTALSHARAGADMVAPSDMMDGRVAAIRARLDEHGFQEVPIISYSAKYASAFYGPFRAAAGSAPSFGDRKGYQMDPHNRREALKECALDVEEGADILMVKPALQLSGRDPGVCRHLRSAHVRLLGVRRVRHDQGGRGGGTHRRVPRHVRERLVHFPGRGQYAHHLLRQRTGSGHAEGRYRLMERRTSEELFERRRRSCPAGSTPRCGPTGRWAWPPASSPGPTGAYHLGCRTGRAYIDYVCSWGPMILGHNHPVIREAVERAVKDGLSFGAPTRREVEIAQLMIEPGAQHRDGAHGEFRHRGGHVRPPSGPGGHRPGQDHQVRGLLPRPLRLSAGERRLLRSGGGPSHLAPACRRMWCRHTLTAQFNDLASVEASAGGQSGPGGLHHRGAGGGQYGRGGPRPRLPGGPARLCATSTAPC